MRSATINRITKETEIRGTLKIEGKARYEISTGVRFLDHMLELFAKHGGFDLALIARGDLDVDQHHTVEDVGIVLGEVRTHELVGGLARGYATLEMDADGRIPETDTLFALTAGAQGPSVSWFFVRDAEGVLGVSGGVPGAQCMPGTAASGIAFSSDIMGTGVPLESVLIHETGHFLGLFHTSELDGTLLDPFDDTPSCGPDRDANGDGMLLPDECVGAGADNVMFWAAMDARTFSPSQRALVQRALLLR